MFAFFPSCFFQCLLFISLPQRCVQDTPGRGNWQFGQPWVTAIAHESPSWLCPADTSSIVPYYSYFLWRDLREMCRSRAASGHFYQGLMPALEMLPATLAPRIFNQVQLGSKRFCSFFWSFNTDKLNHSDVEIYFYWTHSLKRSLQGPPAASMAFRVALCKAASARLSSK